MDNFTGGAGNETFDASRVITGGQAFNSLNNSDQIDGGVGTDTLFVQMSENLNITPNSVKNVEVLSVELMSNNALTLSMINGDATIATVKSNNAANILTVDNLQGKITALEIGTTAASTTVNVKASALSGTTDALDLKLTNVTAGTVTVAPTAAGSGYETITIDSQGSVANVLTALDDGAGTSLTTVNVKGSNDLTLPLTPTTVTTVDASALTGKLTLTVAGGNTQNMTIKGGTANDVINMSGTYTTADTINGGDGTDRLTLTNAEAIAATTTQTGVTNVEVIGLSDGINGAVDVSKFGATGLRQGANMVGAGTVTYAAGSGNTLDLQTFVSGGNNLIATISGTATTDVLGVTMGSTTAGNTFGAGTVTINGAETVNLLSQGGANSFGAAFTITDTAANQALVITGNQNITFTVAVRADAINASGMTGTAALVLTGGTGTTATTITGTGNADTLNGSTLGDIINGGAGADTIANVITGTNSTAADVLTGGLGFDTFILRGDLASGTVATIINQAAQITDFTVGSSATTTDILSLSATVANYSGGNAFHAGIAAATAVAAGATIIQTVAQNAAAAALVAGTDLIKLTTGVATAGLTFQVAFNNAIGTGTVTGLGASTDALFTMYDTTNGMMLVGLVDAAGTTNTIVETADVVTLIGSVTMTAADYASFSSANFSLTAA